MSPYRIFCVLGGVVYLLIFFLIEKKTSIKFISYKPYFYILMIIWVIVCIITGIIKNKKGEDDFF